MLTRDQIDPAVWFASGPRVVRGAAVELELRRVGNRVYDLDKPIGTSFGDVGVLQAAVGWQ